MAYRGMTHAITDSDDSITAELIQRKSFAANRIERMSLVERQSRMQLVQPSSEECCMCDVGSGTERLLSKMSVISNFVTEPRESTDELLKKLHMQQLNEKLAPLKYLDEKGSDEKFGSYTREQRSPEFQRVHMKGDEVTEDLHHSAELLKKALSIRAHNMAYAGQTFPTSIAALLKLNIRHAKDEDAYSRRLRDSDESVEAADPWSPEFPPDMNYCLKAVDGVFNVYKDENCTKSLNYEYPCMKRFVLDLDDMLKMIADGPLKSFCFRQLRNLSLRFQLHVLLNEMLETAAQKAVPHRDFYNIRKVDTHVHASTCMNQKHLLRFIKKTLKNHPDEVVTTSDNKPVTLAQVFKSLKLTKFDLNVDRLDLRAGNTFQRVDTYNKYNPIGEALLRSIFLDTDNYINGKYFAQIIKEVAKDLEDSKYQHAELRLPICGKSPHEWKQLSQWAINNNVYSPNIRWVIQTPRPNELYESQQNLMQSFQELLSNIFRPLFEATNEPNKHPEIHSFLQYVVGFDTVDETRLEPNISIDNLSTRPNVPDQDHPMYGYYIYYIYANMTVLNQFRKARNMNTFVLRPHCGGSGMVQHLVFGFMMAENISHGLQLRKVPVLQYLYYLAQIGIAVSPLSNNSLFIDYPRNPLPDFLARGLKITLSTDDPLKLHFTKEPLMEEYSIAAQVWKLSPTDMAELARNGVLMSGFSDKTKELWLGNDYREEGTAGNDVIHTNLPNVRVAFRHETLQAELANIFKAA